MLERLDRPLRLRQLSGTNWRERAVAALGAALAIGAAGAISALIVGSHAALLLAAPIGASAVILFAVPSSPLGQPWPVIVGTILSIACGILATQLLGHGPLAAGMAVGASILLMSATRSLHPPGGGCALLAVLGGPELLAKGYWLALVPGGLNAALLVVAGLVFHRFSGHSYPHRAVPAPADPRILPEDIDAALEAAQESFDVSRADLVGLFEAAERHAVARRRRA
ncbi:HPP family protein [Sphingomonas sp. CBMAI 2297]|uniref:HPP family protein n=1 Tax=Sphingomonas sp. CBMAI 2297 TaxID=2991720 RepID=UPI0024542D54|nr:HPP family protein [Sphingomonas sp. CBMAI 2297]MDH4745344.1 HPP family protein [Sphingomonas sp. CBMAI 2297]